MSVSIFDDKRVSILTDEWCCACVSVSGVKVMEKYVSVSMIFDERRVSILTEWCCGEQYYKWASSAVFGSRKLRI